MYAGSCMYLSWIKYVPVTVIVLIGILWAWKSIMCASVAVFSLHLSFNQGTLVNLLQALCMLEAELGKWDAG